MATNNIKKITTGILAGAIIVPCMTNEANASNTSLGINEGVVSTNEVVDTSVGQEVVLEKEKDVIKGEASTDKDMNFAKNVVAAQGSITINDTNLKASIYTQLNKQISEELSDSDMKSLTSLTLTGKIESYEGLQAATNLKELVFKQGLFSNKVMNIGLAIILIIELFVFVSPIGRFISIESIDTKIILIVFLINLSSLIIYELIKPILCKYFKD